MGAPYGNTNAKGKHNGRRKYKKPIIKKSKSKDPYGDYMLKLQHKKNLFHASKKGKEMIRKRRLYER